MSEIEKRHLEEYTAKGISEAQRARDSGAISDDEYDRKYNQLMETTNSGLTLS